MPTNNMFKKVKINFHQQALEAIHGVLKAKGKFILDGNTEIRNRK